MWNMTIGTCNRRFLTQKCQAGGGTLQRKHRYEMELVRTVTPRKNIKWFSRHSSSLSLLRLSRFLAICAPLPSSRCLLSRRFQVAWFIKSCFGKGNFLCSSGYSLKIYFMLNLIQWWSAIVRSVSCIVSSTRLPHWFRLYLSVRLAVS